MFIVKKMDFQAMYNSLKTKRSPKVDLDGITNYTHICIYCKVYMSSQQWGPYLEQSYISRFNLGRIKSNAHGDAKTADGKYIEIKISLGSKNGNVNIVQIRPDHTIDLYLIVVYDEHTGVMGTVRYILIPSINLYNLIPLYGNYAHGTTDRHGAITNENIKGRNLEYALRPNIRAIRSLRISKPRALWNALVGYETDEKSVHDALNPVQ